MRSPLAVFALALLALTVAAPGVEAIAGCLAQCPDETPSQGQCSSEACCSCCVHSGPLFTSLPVLEPTLLPVGAASTADLPPVPPARSSDILHVPKPIAA